MFNKSDERAVSAIRALSLAQIEAANSGHPGLPMGAAPMVYVLWNKFLKYNPKNHNWFDRDRFVLSAGHGSAMLYALMHLAGLDVSLDDLKDFRQLKAKTAGHPERGFLDGVEVTTGPLGQGIAQAVGLAIAEKHLAAMYNKDNCQIIDHYTFALCGDGDLMEGISYEAMSLAGHLNLSKLIVLYDSNDVCLDGATNTTFSDDIKKRAEAMHWNYIYVADGTNLDEIYKAISHAKGNWHGPTLIEIKTIIGYGSTNQGTSKVHGAPIGEEEFLKAKEIYEWAEDDFTVPEDVYETFRDGIIRTGERENAKWDELLNTYQEKYPQSYDDLMAGINRELADDFMDHVRKYDRSQTLATRASSSEILQDLADYNPNMWGGSADLFSSNKTEIKSSVAFTDRTPEGRNIWYGVREFAMAAIGNGIIAHGGTWHHVSTFFVFSDYLKPAVRLSALSKLPLTYVMSHDSIAVGEDGPTHQPIDQLPMLRAIPNTIVLRPADANEMRLAWKIALESKDRPVVLATTRQDLPTLAETENIEYLDDGAYIISDSQKETPDAIIIATGSEVGLGLEVQKILRNEGIDLRVVSMPSMELFRQADRDYKEKILPKEVSKRISLEMGSSFGWGEWTGLSGLNIGIDRFGMSGKGSEVAEELGFSVENVSRMIKEFYFV